jgi:hypothetical protein
MVKFIGNSCSGPREVWVSNDQCFPAVFSASGAALLIVLGVLNFGVKTLRLTFCGYA